MYFVHHRKIRCLVQVESHICFADPNLFLKFNFQDLFLKHLREEWSDNTLKQLSDIMGTINTPEKVTEETEMIGWLQWVTSEINIID